MNQNNAIKLLKYQTNSWEKIDELNDQIAKLQKQSKELKMRADRQYMAIAELRELYERVKWRTYGIISGLLLAGIINMILIFI